MKKFWDIELFSGIAMGFSIGVILTFLAFKFDKPKPPHWAMLVRNEYVGLDNYWREVTGYDTLQIMSNYEGTGLYYNFCYPNKWRDSILRRDAGFYLDAVKIVQP